MRIGHTRLNSTLFILKKLSNKNSGRVICYSDDQLVWFIGFGLCFFEVVLFSA